MASDPPGEPRPLASDCCCPDDVDPRIARYFDRRNERRRTGAETYEMGNVTRRLLDALLEADPSGRTVLEGGCGPGALLVELLRAGAAEGTGIDLSAEAIAYARQRAADADVADRATFTVGDAARVDVDARDWVVLDKVICCYPDADGLLARTIGEARRLYAFAVPVSYGWRGLLARLALGFEELVLRVLRRPCRGYVHDVRRIEARLVAAGFAERRSDRLGMWHVGVFARA